MSGRSRSGLNVGRTYTDRSSRLAVPLTFWAAGVGGITAGLWRLWAVRALLTAGTIGSGRVLTAIHLFTLGGFSMLMMGALYQLTPVLLNCPAVRPHTALSQWAVYTLGVTLFVLGFNNDSKELITLGGIGVVAGILFFVINLAGRIYSRTTWNITAWFFATALFYLTLTVVMGGLLGLRYVFGAPSFRNEPAIHVALAAGGWFGLVVIGASYRLWAMFGRKHREPRWWLMVWVLANGAVWCWVIGELAVGGWLAAVGWVSQLAAFLLYAADILQSGLIDRRTRDDPALRALLAGMAFLLVWEVLGSWALVGQDPRLWIPALLSYGLGWIGFSFIGFVQKIVPFMVWLHRYAHVHGRGKMPRLDDIWRPGWGIVPLASGALGLGVVLVGWALRSGILLTVGLALQAVAWLALYPAGLRAVRGPHRIPS
ncbi:MAG: hypothetical protein M0Z36_05015 [Thermaerobacter sp.]|nr:hypothetical protein [Thermaerobacter sp.]